MAAVTAMAEVATAAVAEAEVATASTVLHNLEQA
jgi:hypothetical protein